MRLLLLLLMLLNASCVFSAPLEKRTRGFFPNLGTFAPGKMLASPRQHLAKMDSATRNALGPIFELEDGLMHVDGFGVHDGSSVTVFAHDAIGSVVGRIGPSSSSTTRYDVFGGIRSTAGASASFTDEIGFTAHTNDPETGLVYAKARYMDPAWGMFLSEDPERGSVGDVFSSQGFIYANSNPTRNVDPSGRFFIGAMDYLVEKSTGKTTQQHIEERAAAMGTSESRAVRMAGQYLSTGAQIADVGVAPFRNIARGVHKIGQGKVVEGLGEPIAPIVNKVAMADLERADVGASTSERVKGGIADLTGANECIAGVMGSSEHAVPLSASEQARQGIQGCTQVLQTALGGAATARGLGISGHKFDLDIKLDPARASTLNAGVPRLPIKLVKSNGTTFAPEFVTGYKGRLESVSAKLEKRFLDTGSETSAASRVWSRKMGNATDDAGHAIGNRLGGPGSIPSLNLFPQNLSINRGIFRSLEHSIYKDVMAGKSVSIRQQFFYSSKTATRPYRMTYEVITDGLSELHRFRN